MSFVGKAIKVLAGPEAQMCFEFGRGVFDIVKSLREGGNPNVGRLAGDLFDKAVPNNFKAPNGPATKEEFSSAVYDLVRVFTKQKAGS